MAAEEQVLMRTIENTVEGHVLLATGIMRKSKAGNQLFKDQNDFSDFESDLDEDVDSSAYTKSTN